MVKSVFNPPKNSGFPTDGSKIKAKKGPSLNADIKRKNNKVVKVEVNPPPR
tara:strand:- start:274 stop:426 length:153 start_codon:yes stop_codon:yes gene_type:complete